MDKIQTEKKLAGNEIFFHGKKIKVGDSALMGAKLVFIDGIFGGSFSFIGIDKYGEEKEYRLMDIDAHFPDYDHA
jgi:hypothetical protein